MKPATVFRWALCALLTLPAAHAAVVISTVLYDPLGTESGGEAVELRNDGATLDIGGFVIATETSSADATIPAGTMLASGATYLIADTGWASLRDNPSWRDADHEETLTMANTDSGIALKDASGTIIDAVGWGDAAEIKQGLFEGAPAAEAEAGQALVRDGDTNNNRADFSASEPAFLSGETVLLVVNVTNATLILPLGAALREDDSPEQGVQLQPRPGTARTLHLEAHSNGTAVSATAWNKTIALSGTAGVWTGELALDYWTPPGEHAITVSAGRQQLELPLIVLETRALKLETKTLSLQGTQGRTATGTIKVWNQGNVALAAAWAGTDLAFGKQKIPFAALDVEETTVKPAETKNVKVALAVPATAQPGEYRTMLRLETN
jgi:hypothetical protein